MHERESARFIGGNPARAAHSRSQRPSAVLARFDSGGGRIRQDEVVREDEAIDWARSDLTIPTRARKSSANTWCINCFRCFAYDFRPAIVLGDSRKPETTQFDMVQACSVLRAYPYYHFDRMIALTSSRRLRWQSHRSDSPKRIGRAHTYHLPREPARKLTAN